MANDTLRVNREPDGAIRIRIGQACKLVASEEVARDLAEAIQKVLAGAAVAGTLDSIR